MPRIAYVNGRYVLHRNAMVHIEDRGYQFADGVYEVCEISRGYIMDMTRHLDRLDRSLRELQIAWPMSRKALQIAMSEVIRRNMVKDGLVYLQVTRGVAPRDHPFPAGSVKPAVVITAKRLDPAAVARRAVAGISVITVPENRWDRVDIKTVGLLPNVLARQAAKAAGAHDAWFVEPDGTVREGAASNVWIVTKDNVLVTRQAETEILRGITRTTVIDVAKKLGLGVEERDFTVDEAKNAKEVFMTSATTVVMPVVSVDGQSVANGHPGSTTLSLREAFFDVAEKQPAC